MEFMRDFPDDAACLNWLWRTRYSEDGEHAECPKCDKVRTFKRYETGQRRHSWTCTHCGHHLHPTAGTIYHKSATSLHLWFYAIYLMTSTRCGISAKQIEREIGVTYKTAWRMANLIRNELMGQDDETLEGTVEMDETYVGGKRRGRLGRPAAGDRQKSPVFGMVQRKADGKPGKIVALHVQDVKTKTLMPHVEARVLPASIIYTDELNSYSTLGRRGYFHDRVKHSEQVYVLGDVHTNTIEGFWALLKGGLQGVYHSVSAKHLQSYLSEYAFRYNNRDNGRAMFLTLLLRAARP